MNDPGKTRPAELTASKQRKQHMSRWKRMLLCGRKPNKPRKPPSNPPGWAAGTATDYDIAKRPHRVVIINGEQASFLFSLACFNYGIMSSLEGRNTAENMLTGRTAALAVESHISSNRVRRALLFRVQLPVSMGTCPVHVKVCSGRTPPDFDLCQAVENYVLYFSNGGWGSSTYCSVHKQCIRVSI